MNSQEAYEILYKYINAWGIDSEDLKDAIRIMLNKINQQEKIIDEMAHTLYRSETPLFSYRDAFKDEEEIKQTYERKVKHEI